MFMKPALPSWFTFCFVARWPSWEEATVCFCGRARCFCGFHTVDIKPSHLRGTYCPAHVSVARLAGSSEFYQQQAHPHISDHVHWHFTSERFSCCFYFLVCYYLWALCWGGKGLSLPPALHQSPWCLLAGTSTAALEYIYSREKPIKMLREELKDTSEQRRKRVRLWEGGEGITWEKWVLDKDWDTSGNKWMGTRWLDGKK